MGNSCFWLLGGPTLLSHLRSVCSGLGALVSNISGSVVFISCVSYGPRSKVTTDKSEERGTTTLDEVVFTRPSVRLRQNALHFTA